MYVTVVQRKRAHCGLSAHSPKNYFPYNLYTVLLTRNVSKWCLYPKSRVTIVGRAALLDRTSSIYAAVPAPTEIQGELGREDPTPQVILSNAFVVQSNPRLSKPLWPALKFRCSNKQKLRVYICCTVNHTHSHKLQCIVTDFLNNLMALSFDVSFLAENSSSFTLYTTFLNAISAPVIHTNIANDGCTALYFACTYQYHGQCLYFDPHFCMVLKFG